MSVPKNDHYNIASVFFVSETFNNNVTGRPFPGNELAKHISTEIQFLDTNHHCG
jgi:hypothetical protein